MHTCACYTTVRNKKCLGHLLSQALNNLMMLLLLVVLILGYDTLSDWTNCISWKCVLFYFKTWLCFCVSLFDRRRKNNYFLGPRRTVELQKHLAELCKKRRKVWFCRKLHCKENWLRLVSPIYAKPLSVWFYSFHTLK